MSALAPERLATVPWRPALAARRDPMVVIRWKDIFDRLEEAIDGCKRVSNVLQGIVVKQS